MRTMSRGLLAVLAVASLAAVAPAQVEPRADVAQESIVVNESPTALNIARVDSMAFVLTAGSHDVASTRATAPSDHRAPVSSLSMELAALASVAGTTMRAKMRVQSVEKVSDTQENLRFAAVTDSGFGPDGESEDNTFARYTPTADLTMTVSNPALHGKFEQGQKYYVDFSPAE